MADCARRRAARDYGRFASNRGDFAHSPALFAQFVAFVPGSPVGATVATDFALSMKP
jgi:hypothetical protein